MSATSPPVVVVFDISGSLGTPEALQRSVAVVEDLVATAPETPLALVSVGGPATVVADWSVPAPEVLAAMAALGVGGATPLHDGMVLAASLLGDLPPTMTGPGVVLVIGDGDDSGFGATLADALAALGEVEVWAVVVPTSDTDRERLEVLVGDRGGQVVDVGDTVGLGVLAQRLQPQVVVATTTTTTTTTTTVPVTTIPVVEVSTSTPAQAPAALLVGGGASWFVGMALAVAVMWPRPGATSGLGSVASRLSTGAERLLVLAGRRRSLSAVLDAAGVAVRPGEAVMGALTFAVASGLVLGAITSAAVGLGVALLVPVLAVVLVQRRARRRQHAFAEQLPDVLVSISSALRAGYALSQALDAVARNAEAPAGEELTRVVSEIRLGRIPADALAGMAARTASRDFAWAVTAMEIHRDVGGDLAVIFDTVAQTARERLHLARDIRALTAEGRVSAMVLTALPPLLVIVLSAASPGYLEPLTTSPGPALLGLAGVLTVLGWWWMKLLVRSGVRA
jgi:tight adherence protein B